MKIEFTLNHQKMSIEAPPELRLLDLLRDYCGLTGTKEGCGKGECGACSVIMNSKLVNSCLVPVCQIDDSEIVTIEGLEKDGELDKLQHAFINAGAVQCGFCIPGMIMAAKALLMQNPHPSEEEIKKGLSGNLCRCTGYAKIIEAVAGLAGNNNRL